MISKRLKIFSGAFIFVSFYLLIGITLLCPKSTEAADASLISSGVAIGTGYKNVFEMSLEELTQARISVPAAITKLPHAETPASITVITAQNIQHTPARNIYDLIEVYVPGAIWMNFEDGPQLGIRGNIVNRNYKYLLSVNGRVLNNKGHYGAKSELEQWDLSDIQRIEIIRGPGSVTYGPGAVAGIINIITHDASSEEGMNVAAQYVDKYDSKGFSISNSYKAENFNLFAYGSITRTHGLEPRNFLGGNNNEADYIGEGRLSHKVPLDYFADYQDNPQIKLHLDADFLEHCRFWVRYTQEGSTWRGNEVKTDFGEGPVNQAGIRDRQWISTFQFDSELSDDFSLSAMLSADSSDVERRRDNAYHSDQDNILNKEIDFSEFEVFFRTKLNWEALSWAEIAFGFEYSWDHFGPGWGDDKKDMRLAEDGIIVSGPSSNALDPEIEKDANQHGNALFVNDGWHTDTFSFFSEANITVNPWIKILLSGRTDKNTYSDWLFSPRLALISHVKDGHFLKLIVQRSLRMNTASQNYFLDQNGIDPEKEELTGAEVIYSAFPNEHLSFSLSGFWNDLDVIAWNQDVQRINHVGNLKIYGVEPEINYKWLSGMVGASYSWVKQIDWQMADGVISSGISYSDYNQPLSGSDAVQLGVGNDINNWPNQAFKFFGRVDLTEKLILHADARLLWDFQGLKDGLTGLRRAVAGQPEEVAVDQSIQKVEGVGTYDYDFRFNVSFSYTFREDLSVRFFVQNLFGSNRNKRYSYDFSGNNKTSPHRVRFIEEPRTYGIRMDYKL